MSRPSILHSLICITVVGVFLFPFYLVTSMAACISVNMFLTLNALHLLPLIFPLGCFVCCSSPEPAAMFLSKVCIVTALTLHCLGRPSSHMGQEAYAPGRLRPGFSCIPCFWPRTSPPGSARARLRGGRGAELARVLNGVSSLGWLCLHPPLAERMSKKNGYLRKLASKFPV